MKKLIQSLHQAKARLEKTICTRDDLAHADTWDDPNQREKYNELTETMHYYVTQIEDMIDQLSANQEEVCRVFFS